jgi:hypothetical protein
MNRVVCHFTATEFDILKNYLGKWKFWIKWWRWRIVSLSFSPWDDLYTLTLHRSPSIESRGYLADVNDNVFQSLDEYLFTVLTDEAPEPPTPDIPIPTIAPNAGSILPSTTITISVTSPATGAEYSFDNETWIPYSAPFTLASNSTVYARATDGDGNYSEVVCNAYTILPYDAEVEYIESSGTQYIDTGIISADDFSWELKFEGGQRATSIIGARSSSVRTICLYYYTSSAREYTIPIAGLNGTTTPFQLTDLHTGVHIVKAHINTNVGNVWVDNVQVYTNQSFSGNYISNVSCAVFAAKYGNNDYREKVSAKIYSYKMWQGDTLVFDGIPVRKDGKGCLYDRVSGTLFENAGTGDITYGNDVE